MVDVPQRAVAEETEAEYAVVVGRDAPAPATRAVYEVAARLSVSGSAVARADRRDLLKEMVEELEHEIGDARIERDQLKEARGGCPGDVPDKVT